jgi:putative DNA primase/helicase
LIIQFPKQFIGEERNPKMLDVLTTKEEMSGCFNWAIEGLGRLIENGCFSNELDVSTMRRLYRKLSSPIAAFSEVRLEEDPERHITKEEMYAQFVQFCKKERLIPVSKPKFGRDFMGESGLAIREGNTKMLGKNTKVWQNVKFG